MKKYLFCFLFSIFFVAFVFTSCKKKSSIEPFYYDSEESFIANNAGLSDSALIGKLIFFDKNLSEPAGLSCASCHSPMSGFSDPRHTPFSEGAVNQLSLRNASAISYMGFAPNRRAEIVRGVWETVGGFFWDGKAEFLNQQALFPMLNPQEMNNHSFGMLADKFRRASYYPQLEKLFGKENLADSQTIAYYAVTCLQAFELSHQVNQFTSKFDFYLQGKITLTAQEMRGMQLFTDSSKTKCNLCHLSVPTTYASTNKILFTDFSYDNIGLPKNPLQAGMPVDSGLAIFERRNPLEVGRFKTPTLRNIAITAPYMHSGIFTTLEEVLDFYNVRDVDARFAHPEVSENINDIELGDLKLTKQEMDDIIVFLKTLTDGYRL